MSAPGPDEKLCPFCAETIRRAAIKCRYCGSELPPETASAAGVVKEEPGRARRWSLKKGDSAESPEARVWKAPVTDLAGDGAAATQTPRGRLLWPILVLLLVAGVLAVYLSVERANAEETTSDGTVTSNSARAVAMQRAADSTATILSYAADSFDADAEKAGELMTEGMRTEYLEALKPVKDKVVKEGIVLKATAVATSLTHYKGDTVRALVFVNQSTTAKGANNEQLDNNRIVVTMKRTKGDWLISKMDPF